MTYAGQSAAAPTQGEPASGDPTPDGVKASLRVYRSLVCCTLEIELIASSWMHEPSSEFITRVESSKQCICTLGSTSRPLTMSLRKRYKIDVVVILVLARDVVCVPHKQR